ncbi:MAG TPA: hypothetical protein VHG53_06155 [Candidatus Limnocylindria bacterium]|nr:hypothetical protein [Candidatus Limnocylindria bacterium]
MIVPCATIAQASPVVVALTLATASPKRRAPGADLDANADTGRFRSMHLGAGFPE